MKVLGIVCSSRKEGNAEALVREALLGAAEKGADTDLARATTIGVCISISTRIWQVT